jgi:hypothetical protein
LATDPLARDPRIPIKWVSGKSGVKWHAGLTGNEGVHLYWHKVRNLIGGSKTRMRVEPRAPTAVCINVLLALLREGQKGNPIYVKCVRELNTLCFESKYQIDTNRFYPKAALDAVRMWQQLAITWGDLELPPPIAHIDSPRLGPYIPTPRWERGSWNGPWQITMSQQWLELCSKSKAPKITVPLPMVATPQNIVLKTLMDGTQANVVINPFSYKVSGNGQAAPRKSTRNGPSFSFIPLESWLVAEKWYKKNGGGLKYMRYPYKHVPGKSYQLPSTMMHIQVVRP